VPQIARGNVIAGMLLQASAHPPVRLLRRRYWWWQRPFMHET